MLSPTHFLRLATDPRRLALLGAAVLGPVDADEAATRLQVPEREILAELFKLREAGLITPDGRLDRQLLREVAAQVTARQAAGPEIVEGPWTSEEVKVLSTFFQGSRLTRMPTQRSRRLVVLERLAQEFEPGIRYPERQVNAMLLPFNDDYAAMRRYLVDDGLLSREDGVYWRSGGRYVRENGGEGGQGDEPTV